MAGVGVSAVTDKHTEIISEPTDDFLIETWEPVGHLQFCKDKIDAFEEIEK